MNPISIDGLANLQWRRVYKYKRGGGEGMHNKPIVTVH